MPNVYRTHHRGLRLQNFEEVRFHSPFRYLAGQDELVVVRQFGSLAREIDVLGLAQTWC